MTADPILVVAWLVLAHLVADFVLQTGGMARAKSTRGSTAVGGLLAHGLVVAICAAPVGLAYGAAGWWYVAATAVSHVVIDRLKVVLTRRAASAALRDAHARHESGPQPVEHLGRAWTPQPAALFLADQAAHLAVIGLLWAAIPPAASLQPAWVEAVNWALGSHDRAAVHQVVSLGVVLTALLIVNVRAASLFVSILVRPVEAGADGEHRWGGRAASAVEPIVAAPSSGPPLPSASGRRWSIRFGPLEGRVVAEPEPGAGSGRSEATVAPVEPAAVSARVGSTIGVLERILVVVFVLTGSDVAIGFVVAAKTLARFRQLDDRAFAEYYLLGTLASVSVAILTALAGRAALGVLFS
jgi:hypothetical protein